MTESRKRWLLSEASAGRVAEMSEMGRSDSAERSLINSHSEREEKSRWFIHTSSPTKPASPVSSIQSLTNRLGPLPFHRFFSSRMVERYTAEPERDMVVFLCSKL